MSPPWVLLAQLEKDEDCNEPALAALPATCSIRNKQYAVGWVTDPPLLRGTESPRILRLRHLDECVDGRSGFAGARQLPALQPFTDQFIPNASLYI